MGNLQTVQQLYAAFGRGDVPTILEYVADDVEWEYDQVEMGVPILSPGRGKEHALRFFQALGSGVEITVFEIKALLEGDGIVVGIIELEATVRATGRSVSQRDEVHLWTFGEDGLVTAFCHRVDSHQWWLAYQSD